MREDLRRELRGHWFALIFYGLFLVFMLSLFALYVTAKVLGVEG